MAIKKMTEARIKQGKILILKRGWTMQRLAEKYGVAEVTIWRHIGGKKENIDRAARGR